MANRFASPVILEAGAEPPTPGAGLLALYAKKVAGRILPKWVGPSGLDSPLQNALWANMIIAWFSGNAANISSLGGAPSNVGTISNPAPTSTNLRTRARRFLITSNTTAGSMASLRSAVLCCSRDTGFFYAFRGGLASTVPDIRWFAGLWNAITAPSNVDPTTSTARATIGLAINSDSGNLKLVHCTDGAAPTVIDLGANFPVNVTDLYELVLTCAPGASSVFYRVRNLSTGNETEGELSTNLPASTEFLAPVVWATNNTTAATAVAWDVSRVVVEIDY